MAALDFPNSPTLNQIYNAPNGAAYKWDGVVWMNVTGVTAAPSGPAGGALTGTYPNPGVQYSLITGIPSSLPPSGSAGGVLTGTYPNPSIATNAVTYAMLSGTVQLNIPSAAPQIPQDVGKVLTVNGSGQAAWTAAASGPWQDVSGVISPVVSTDKLAVLGGTTLGQDMTQVILGTRTMKARLISVASFDWAGYSINARYDGSSWTKDTTGQPSWFVAMNLASDNLNISRIPAGSTTATAWLTLTNTGQLQLPGPSGAGIEQAPVLFGPRTQRGRLIALSGADALGLSLNSGNNGSGWTRDDTGQPAWQFLLRTDTDQTTLSRVPAAGGTPVNFLQVDNVGRLFVNGDATAAHLVMSTQTAKTRLQGVNTGVSQTLVSINRDAIAASQDDATKPSWVMVLHTGADQCIWQRQPAGGALATIGYLDASGNLVINGATGQKASGTTWANPSDERIKKNVQPYTRGLDAIIALEPMTFEFNGVGGSQDGMPGIGFIAQHVQPVMPEMVFLQAPRANAPKDEPTDLLMMDTTALPLALVNAVKELADRVAALEAR